MYYEYYFYYASIIKYVNNYEKYSVHCLFFFGLEKDGISMFNWEMSWAKAGGIWLYYCYYYFFKQRIWLF